jgi:hypothetical protein
MLLLPVYSHLYYYLEVAIQQQKDSDQKMKVYGFNNNKINWQPF